MGKKSFAPPLFNYAYPRILYRFRRLSMSLGFTYEIQDGLPAVTSVEGSGPADRAGIKKGDKILEVCDRPESG